MLPTTVAVGAVIAPAVQVALWDAQGNTVTGSTASVTLAITSGTGTVGAVLAGTLAQAAVNGVATFANLTIDQLGTGYSLTATASGLTSATTSTFAVTPGAAAKLAFAVQPANATDAVTLSPAVLAVIQDAVGNTIRGATTSVTLAIGTNPGAGTLSGTTTVAAINGVATFSDVGISGAGTGYTLTAAATGLTGATSATFNVTGDLDGKWGWVFNGNPGGSSINLTLLTAGPRVSGSGAVCGIGPSCNPGAVSVTGQHVPGFGAFSITLAGSGHSIAYDGQFNGPDTLVGTWIDGSSSRTVTLGRCTASSFCW